MRVCIYLCLAFAGWLASASPVHAAAQVPQVWTTNVVAGEFPSQQAALAAVRAQGGAYAFAENVESIQQTSTATTFVYGANSRAPDVGPWYSFTLQWALTNPHPSEQAAMDSVLAWSQSNAPSCPAASIAATGDWAPSHYFFNSGITDTESRFYNLDYPVPPSCGPGNVKLQGTRVRVVQCPAGLNWNSTDKICARNNIALIISRPMPCSDCDLQHNPVNVSTGDKYQAETDVELPWLTLTRHYHSAYSVPGAGLGIGWTHALNVQYYKSGSSGGLILPNGDTLPIQNSEAVDGSGWKVAPVSGGYEVSKPSQVLRFNTLGRLTKIDDLNGSTITLQYDGAGRLTTAAHSSGRSITFEYEIASTAANQRLRAIKQAGTELVSYEYDSAGRLEFARYPDTTAHRYHYENATYPNHLTGITDEVDQRYSTYGYNADGYATLSEHAGGVYRGTFDYLPDGSTAYADANGRIQVFQFTGDGSYRKITDIADTAGVQSTAYALNAVDFRRRPISKVDKQGVVTTYSYLDAFDASFGFNVRLTTTQQAVGTPQARTLQTWRNLSTGWLLKQKDVLRETVYSRNGRGQALSVTERDLATNATRVMATAYCEQADINAAICPLIGLATSIDGARTDVADQAIYTYYPSDDATCVSSPATCPHRKGDLWKVTDALGRITETLAYDGAGRPLSVKDANGIITDMEYHSRGWLTARKVRGTNNAVETDDQITQIEYWPTGLVKKVTQPDGAFTGYTYDAAHRLTDIADNAGNTIHYTLDNAGNRTAEATKDSGGNLKRTLSRVYNQLGQLQTAKDAYNHATGFTYDANGNNQLVTDALSRVTDNDYDPLNRLARTLQDVGGIAAETKFEYDALDNLTKVTDPKGLDTTYQYNGLGDLTQLASPDTGTTLYTYDSAGNRKTQTDARGIVSTYSYDALNRLTGIAYPTSSLNVGYIYDTANPVCIAGETFAIGRLTKMTDSSGDTQYCYDRFGNLTRKVQTTNAKVFTLRYAYTLAGQLQAITYPDGAIVDYVRDGQGRITEVGATPAGGVRAILLNQATYHPFGPVAGWVYGNGRTMSRPLNQNYQPTAVVDNATGGLSLGYEFDAVGNLSKLYNADQSITLAQYGYDALNRLADVKDGPTGTVIEHYAYDATGNRTSFTNAGGTTNYTYPGTNHRLTQVGATARTYDDVGNTTQIGGIAKEFVYNDAGRMSQVKVSGAATMNYLLNGRGEQVRKYLSTANTYTLYDEAGRWAGDYDSAGTAIQQAIWLDDLPVGLFASNQFKYVQPDHLGTPRAVIDPTPNVVIWRWDLEGEAFGTTVPNQDPDGNGTLFVFNMRFPGQRNDAVSGLNYNYSRAYDPGTGRYVESDPIGLVGGISTFAYVHSAPLVYADPLGLQTPAMCANPANAAACAAAGEITAGATGAAASTDVAIGAGATAALIGSANSALEASKAACPPGGNDPCKGIRDQLQAHIRKLQDYMDNPLMQDNRGSLLIAYLMLDGKQATYIYEGRIRTLQKQVKNWIRELEKCETMHGK